MTQDELKEVKDIIQSSRGGCLCGHGEFCSSCDGTETRMFHSIYAKLDARFGQLVNSDECLDKLGRPIVKDMIVQYLGEGTMKGYLLRVTGVFGNQITIHASEIRYPAVDFIVIRS